MVSFKGIGVHLVSQFDNQVIPEYRPRESDDPSDKHNNFNLVNKNGVSCYIPTLPGSQVHFAYDIEGPHPAQASYFFKLRHNDQIVTNWDCTSEHEYKGKVGYNIEYVGKDLSNGLPLVKRRAFKFAHKARESIGPLDDYLELRIYRVEHRQRVPLDSTFATDVRSEEKSENYQGFCVVNAGLQPDDCPKRYYRYQLLDAKDKPYAAIRWYYRPRDWLVEHGIVPGDYASPKFTAVNKPIPSTASKASVITADSGSPYLSSPFSLSCTQPNNAISCWSPIRNPEENSEKLHYLDLPELPSLGEDGLKHIGVEPCEERGRLPKHTEDAKEPKSRGLAHSPACVFEYASVYQDDPESPRVRVYGINCPPPAAEEDSLSINAKDSLEDLHMSPSRYKPDPLPGALTNGGARSAENGSPPPKKLQKKNLTLNLDRAEFDIQKTKRQTRTLSPSTGRGRLKRMLCPVPPSAPAALFRRDCKVNKYPE